MIDQGSKAASAFVDRFVGSRIRLRRRELNISQARLGETIGVSFQQVRKYENGDNRVGAGALFWIADFLGVPIEYFYDGCALAKGSAGDTSRPTCAPSVLAFAYSPEGQAFSKALSAITDKSSRQLLLNIAEIFAEREIAARKRT